MVFMVFCIVGYFLSLLFSYRIEDPNFKQSNDITNTKESEPDEIVDYSDHRNWVILATTIASSISGMYWWMSQYYSDDIDDRHNMIKDRLLIEENPDLQQLNQLAQVYRKISHNHIERVALLMKECIKNPEICKKEQRSYKEYHGLPGYEEGWKLFNDKIDQKPIR
jgi:hypothetical protein